MKPQLPTNIIQVDTNEWLFEYYGTLYTYYANNDDKPFTEAYSCNEQGIWVSPYLCITAENQYLPLDGNNAAEQLAKFMSSGDHERARSIVYNKYGSDPAEYHSGSMQKLLPSYRRFK